MSVINLSRALVAVVLGMAIGASASPTLEARICCGNPANCPSHCVRVSVHGYFVL
ncbi:hypothetical protein ISF_01319 [Cordyceps fumosorosea ARSEF 2679]|uniref:Uncharacterized protein n=1 Tax=Cordyceps fumosorosea (strain ARSEF 2679) TaxID=1081104 RepID=A0A168D744_CORFA|nr:hypothetical protein ISF_01319 [Cordyceps fumosorosea ARSEF 2679]OAA72246.1 hypothetical protein ISF_01319 [Cordyceps fumosorosea ARSEF 2679]